MRKEEYPVYGQIPTDQTLTACEALCWIGYKRAIPKDLYFSPYDGPDVKLSTLFNDDTFLHRAIPEPKPKDDPIGAAERLLLSALRDGSVHAFFKSENSGTLEPLPTRAVQCEVTISVRGALEPDGNVSMEKFAIAHAECVHGALYFPTSEILRLWPMPMGADMAPAKSIGAETRTQAWLIDKMKAQPGAPISKKTIRDQVENSGVPKISNRAFERAYAAAASAANAEAWTKPGRRPKSPHP